MSDLPDYLNDALEMLGATPQSPQPIEDFMPMFLAWERVSSDTVDFKLLYVDMADDLMAGLLLSQIVYWHLPSKKSGKSKLRVRRDGHWWIAKERTEWYDEIRLTERQIDRCMEILEQKGLVERQTFLFNGKRTTHTRIIWEAFSVRWTTHMKNAVKQANHQLVISDSPTGDFGLTQSVTPLTETTTETTTEKTTTGADAPGSSHSFMDEPQPQAAKYSAGKPPIEVDCPTGMSKSQPETKHRCECGAYVFDTRHDECPDCGQRYIWRNSKTAGHRARQRKKAEQDAAAKSDEAVQAVLKIATQFPETGKVNLFSFQTTIRQTRAKLDPTGQGLIGLAERAAARVLSNGTTMTKQGFMAWVANSYAKYGPDAFREKGKDSASQKRDTSWRDDQNEALIRKATEEVMARGGIPTIGE